MDENWRLGDEPPHFQDEEIIDPTVQDSDSSDIAETEPSSSQNFNSKVDYKQECRYLKKKMKFLIYVSVFQYIYFSKYKWNLLFSGFLNILLIYFTLYALIPNNFPNYP